MKPPGLLVPKAENEGWIMAPFRNDFAQRWKSCRREDGARGRYIAMLEGGGEMEVKEANGVSRQLQHWGSSVVVSALSRLLPLPLLPLLLPLLLFIVIIIQIDDLPPRRRLPLCALHSRFCLPPGTFLANEPLIMTELTTTMHRTSSRCATVTVQTLCCLPVRPLRSAPRIPPQH